MWPGRDIILVQMDLNSSAGNQRSIHAVDLGKRIWVETRSPIIMSLSGELLGLSIRGGRRLCGLFHLTRLRMGTRLVNLALICDDHPLVRDRAGTPFFF